LKLPGTELEYDLVKMGDKSVYELKLEDKLITYIFSRSTSSKAAKYTIGDTNEPVFTNRNTAAEYAIYKYLTLLLLTLEQ
jgi:hypothetical protein